MDVDDVPEVGDSLSFSRTFTNDEVRQFAELSQDKGYHHLVEDDDGSIVIHGLLTATMPTKLGGDLDFIARTLEFEFPRPAYTGEELTSESTLVEREELDDRFALTFAYTCTDEDGEVVMEGESEGVIMKSVLED